MKKVLLLAMLVLMTAGCTVAETTEPTATPTLTPDATAAETAEPTIEPTPAATPEREHMASYLKYLSTSNSDYCGVYENSGKVDPKVSYGYVGNNSSQSGFYLLFKLPTDFPFDGNLLGTYEIDSDDVSAATLRIMEVNKGTRGSGTLGLKISPIRGTWNGSAAFNSIPAWDASVVQQYSSFGAVPSASNYSTRTGYHAGTYTKTEYVRNNTNDPWQFYRDDSISQDAYSAYYNLFGGVSRYDTGYYGYNYNWTQLTSTPAYYDYYYKYYTIDIKDVIKDCIKNGATGLLLYFDLSSTSHNRKVFTTVLETADSRRPAISITFDEGSGTTISLKGAQDGIWKTPAGFKGIYNGAWADVGGIKAVKEIDGVKTWVDVMS